MTPRPSRKAGFDPTQVRQRATLFWGVLLFVAGAFVSLTLLVATVPAFAIDLQITRSVQWITFQPFALFMGMVSWPGFNPQVMIIAGLIVVVLYGWGLHWEAVMALLAALLATAVNLLVKNLIQRPRPLPEQVTVVATLTSYSFPSGHVMFYLGFFGFLGFLAYRLLQPSLRRTLLLVFLGGLVLLIGLSRVYLGQHWASDVLGSYLLGSLLLVALVQVYRWGKTRGFVYHLPGRSRR
jgi:membrane-associated phospholipid phosphatase